MTTRQLRVVVLAILGVTLCDVSQALADDGGTVTWSAGYPKANPSQMMGMIPGSVDVLGGYAAFNGWHAVSGNLTWTKVTGGGLNSVVLDIGDGKIGKRDPVTTLIGPARTLLAKGAYQGWLTMA